MKNSGIGGQAVMEGVMMKNRDRYAVAVRKQNGEIEIVKGKYTNMRNRHKAADFPVIRGVFSFVESLRMGMKALNISASFLEEENTEKEKDQKERRGNIVMGIVTIVAVIVAVALFVLFPFFLSESAKRVIRSAPLRGFLEGVIRVALFVGYVKIISCAEEIKRVFMYHGAEHKTINCLENGLELTMGNIKKQSVEHRRCGTGFMLTVMLLSILFFMFIVVGNVWMRMVLRIVLIPVIAGISYEFICFTGNHDGRVINILSRPSMWLQSLTTKEPDEEMLEVARAALDAVYDKKYRKKKKKYTGKKAENSHGRSGNTIKENIGVSVEEEDPILNSLDRYFKAPGKEGKS